MSLQAERPSAATRPIRTTAIACRRRLAGVLGAGCSTRERVYPEADDGGGAELLQLLADDARARIVRRELQEPLVGGDRRRGVTDLLGGLRELELDVRVVRLERDEALVRVDGERRLRLRVLERSADLTARLRVDRRADAVGEDRLPGRTGQRREPLRRRAEGRADLEDLRVALTLRGA